MDNHSIMESPQRRTGLVSKSGDRLHFSCLRPAEVQTS